MVLVDRDALLTFIQYRIKAFNPALAEQKLEAMSGEGLSNNSSTTTSVKRSCTVKPCCSVSTKTTTSSGGA